MDITFHIMLHLKTMDGHENFGKFCIGQDREIAESIFHQLKGNSNVTDQCGLCLEFIEMHDNLPYDVRLMSCTLDQLAENVKVITKATFKRFAV